MKANFDIIFNKSQEKDFIQVIQKQVLNQMADRFRKEKGNIQLKIYEEIFSIWKSPEVVALVSGPLRYDLGVLPEEVQNVIQGIIDIVYKDIDFKMIQSNYFIKIELGLLKTNYDEILSIPGAEFIQTFYKKQISGRPYTVKWLEWLLIRGHDIVVEEYHVSYSINPHITSRTAGAIMKKGGQFIIPSQFTGTPVDNFITRSLVGIDKIIYQELERILS